MNIHFILLFIISFCNANAAARGYETMLATYLYVYDPQAAGMLLEGAREKNEDYPKPQFKNTPSIDDTYDFIRYFAFVMTKRTSEPSLHWNDILTRNKVIVNNKINIDYVVNTIQAEKGKLTGKMTIVQTGNAAEDEEENSKRYKSIILGTEQISNGVSKNVEHLPLNQLINVFKGLVQIRGQGTLEHAVNVPEEGYNIYEFDEQHNRHLIEEDRASKMRTSYLNYLSQFSGNTFDVDTYVNNYNENKNVLNYYLKEIRNTNGKDFIVEESDPAKMNHVYIINRITHIINKCN